MSERPVPDPRAWEERETPAGVPDRALLQFLAADAAGRAAAMLAGSAATSEGGVSAATAVDAEDPLVDAVRLLAAPGGAPYTGAVAGATGLEEGELRRLALAHRHGGTGGVAAALAPTHCGAAEMAAAADEVRRRRALSDDDLSVEPGELTLAGAGVRLRLGPDRRWYPFTFARSQWWPAAGANASVGAAYQAAVRARSARRAST